jgi:hypothetical protein
MVKLSITTGFREQVTEGRFITQLTNDRLAFTIEPKRLSLNPIRISLTITGKILR